MKLEKYAFYIQNCLDIMNNEKIPGNLLKKPGKIMEFCQSGKVGTLQLYLYLNLSALVVTSEILNFQNQFID